MSKCNCGEYVLKGQVCSKGNKHEMITGQMIFWGVVVAGLVAVGIWYWKGWKKVRIAGDGWGDSSPFMRDWINKGWTLRDGTFYSPGE